VPDAQKALRRRGVVEGRREAVGVRVRGAGHVAGARQPLQRQQQAKRCRSGW